MKLRVIPNVDIVLSNGMFLKKGFEIEVEMDNDEISFLSPYMSTKTLANDKEQQQQKAETPKELPKKVGRPPKKV